MAIVNRTLDVSEQRRVFETKAGAVATGVTGIVAFVPYAGTLDSAQIAAFGLSGSPTWKLQLNRFVVGAGATAWDVTGAAAVAAFGTSGLLANGMSLLASGSTLLNLQAGDVIMYVTAGTNAAVTGAAVSITVKPLQDIKTFFGLA